ncbi:MAG: pyridoxamine 5'-phosphate oxidase family protein [Eubacterium sp.]|nr:pyridoxamine 5'-phosphate oxidase family protein [Eubacterium sp.]
MQKLTKEAEQILTRRFGKDSVIALATVEDGIPDVRNVNAYYENGAFYIITHALSDKMKQIEKNPVVAVAGEWFTAHGKGTNLGYFGKPENTEIAEKLKKVFAEWIDNGHNDFSDKNTCILCVKLTNGELYSHGTRYDIDFGEKEYL